MTVFKKNFEKEARELINHLKDIEKRNMHIDLCEMIEIGKNYERIKIYVLWVEKSRNQSKEVVG